jgi:chromosomal replication initiation ATPase DnaA
MKETLITAQDIIADVAQKHSIWEFEITGQSRRKEIMIARREACQRLYKIWYTQQRIWEMMWNRNHASIWYLLKYCW